LQSAFNKAIDVRVLQCHRFWLNRRLFWDLFDFKCIC
jgi:hypothetical protein